jgi:signal transduction histidine kinase
MNPRRARGIGRLATVTLRARLFLSHVTVALAAIGSMFVTTRILAPKSFRELIRGNDAAGSAAELAHAIENAFDHALTLSLASSLAIGAAIAVVVSRLVLRPLDRIRAATHRLAAGNYGEQMVPPQTPELGRLAQDVNRLAWELQSIERRRARLISEVAHEMRTPLTTLRGQLDGLADGIFAPTAEFLASLTDDLDRLHRLASDLSTLSLAGEGAFELTWAETDLSVLVARTAERLKPQFDDAGVALLVRALMATPVRADPDRVEQILVNLLGNALAASDRGGQVTIASANDQGYAVVTVTDTGVGIAAEHLERVFQRFERIEHPGRPAAAGGSGIGLTIARGIAAAHHGDLTARSDGVGRGAAFQLRIPTGPMPPTAPGRAP